MAYGPLRTHFLSRKRIHIEEDKCVGCKLCMRSCSLDDVIGYKEDQQKVYVKNPLACGGCAACLRGCPTNAIHMKEELIIDEVYYQQKNFSAPGQATTE